MHTHTQFFFNYSFDSLLGQKVWCHWSIPLGVQASNWKSSTWLCVPIGLEPPMPLHALTYTYSLMCYFIFWQSLVPLTAKLMIVTPHSSSQFSSLSREERQCRLGNAFLIYESFLKRHCCQNLIKICLMLLLYILNFYVFNICSVSNQGNTLALEVQFVKIAFKC